MAEEYNWGKHTAKIIRMKAQELLDFADKIESAKTMEEMHKLSLEVMEEPKPCNCTDKEKFTEKLHEVQHKPLVDWRTLNSEFTRIMNDKNYGRP